MKRFFGILALFLVGTAVGSFITFKKYPTLIGYLEPLNLAHIEQGSAPPANERQLLYQVQLLPQIHEQAEASLTAYTNDDGDFAEVVRSRIAELNAQIDALGIDVERQKNIIELNYYFIENSDDIIADNSPLGEMK